MPAAAAAAGIIHDAQRNAASVAPWFTVVLEAPVLLGARQRGRHLLPARHRACLEDVE